MDINGSVHLYGAHYVTEDATTRRLYKKGKILGRGAFGRCYKFTDLSSRQVFAVKMIPHTRKSVTQQRGGVSVNALSRFQQKQFQNTEPEVIHWQSVYRTESEDSLDSGQLQTSSKVVENDPMLLQRMRAIILEEFTTASASVTEELCHDLREIGQSTASWEMRIDDATPILQSLDYDFEEAQNEITLPKEQLEDYENRAPRCNLWIWGLPENITDLQEYVTALFQELVPEIPPERLEMDRVQRTFGTRCQKGPPRDVVSLAHILSIRKILTEPEVRYYMQQILHGVQFLHLHRIIHRDLKLSNCFIAKNMIVKIGDLGLATTVDQCEKVSGVICGTPNYLSPEVLAKDGHSFKSDIWAIGCIMYTLLTGYSPFRAYSQKEMQYFIREGFYPVPSYISVSGKKLIISLLETCPTNRPGIEDIRASDFFTQGFTPKRLSSASCNTAPTFLLSIQLTSFFSKAAKVLYQGIFHKSFCSDSREAKEYGKSMVVPTQRRESLSTDDTCEEEKTEDNIGPSDESLAILMRGRMISRRKSALQKQKRPLGEKVVEDVTGILKNCLFTIKPGELDPSMHVNFPILWVTKWVDYSNKYGFGYKLSDDCTGVLLSDGTHVVFSPYTQKVCYSTCSEEHITFPEWNPPCKLEAKMRILKFFFQYMQENVLEGGDLRGAPSLSVRTLCLLQFLKTDQALLMLFSNGTLQVNFYHDRTKIILSKAKQGYLMSFVDQERQSCTVPLSALRAGCSALIIQRMEYALIMLQTLKWNL
ncbi:inactive serine/threonine-protein kinase PLK5 [Pyxicephalus adspersus]|uniref:inactive serine/threonine-protein kinase PLK5 n=1 Tax=Pyxicephalus adspersus TaxID=30357 RepID=UPI003B5B0292